MRQDILVLEKSTLDGCMSKRRNVRILDCFKVGNYIGYATTKL